MSVNNNDNLYYECCKIQVASIPCFWCVWPWLLCIGHLCFLRWHATFCEVCNSHDLLLIVSNKHVLSISFVFKEMLIGLSMYVVVREPTLTTGWITSYTRIFKNYEFKKGSTDWPLPQKARKQDLKIHALASSIPNLSNG